MKAILKVIAGALIGLAVSGTAAAAADLPYKAPVAVAPEPIYSWTGFYIGVNAGYGFSAFPLGINAGDPNTAAALAAIGNPGVIGPNAGGAVGGAQAGINWQVSQSWVWGVATSFDFTNIGSNASAVLGVMADQARIDWYGTATGRIGYLIDPAVLLYGEGGLAYGNISHNATVGCLFGPGGLCINNGTSNIHAGWTAGAGLEWRFSPRLSLDLKYRYVDLGTSSLVLTGTGAAPATFNSTDKANFNVVTAGLNFKF